MLNDEFKYCLEVSSLPFYLKYLNFISFFQTIQKFEKKLKSTLSLTRTLLYFCAVDKMQFF